VKILLNFSHDLNESQRKQFETEHGEYLYIWRMLRINFVNPLVPQIIQIVDSVERELVAQNISLRNCGSVYMIAPGLTDPAILLYQEVFGRNGDPPNLVMMRRDYDKGGFKIYQTINGVEFRQCARGRREKVKQAV
jgi:hypothetical protein